MSELHIVGGEQLQRFLSELPTKIERNIMRSALRSGAMVILARARSLVPVKSGTLQRSLRVSTNSKGGVVTANMRAGGKIKRGKGGGDAYYAHMVEWGTRMHTIATKGGSLKIGGRFVGKSVLHKGARAHPFMRPALDGGAQSAIVAVADRVRSRLTKAGIDVADSGA